MAAHDRRIEASESNRTLIIIVAVAAAVVIALFFYVLMRAGSGGSGEPTLQGAIRPGSPEFERYKSQVILEEPEAFESPRALGDIVMSLKTTVRNVSGKTLNGLEVRGAVVDHQGKAVKERTVIVIPARQPELPTNKTMEVTIALEGMTQTDDRANIKMEITGLRFKE